MAATAAASLQAGRTDAAEAIHIEDLHKKFGALHVLKGVSLSARDGDVVAIIGGSGSGTSTLLRSAGILDTAVVRLLPDTLMISVKERRQLAVWQYGGKSVVIDDHGDVIPEADPARFNTLPLVVGAEAAGEIAAGISHQAVDELAFFFGVIDRHRMPDQIQRRVRDL